MNPNRYDMPTKQQVQSAITALAAEEKKEKRRAAGRRCAEGDSERNRTEAVEQGAKNGTAVTHGQVPGEDDTGTDCMEEREDGEEGRSDEVSPDHAI